MSLLNLYKKKQNKEKISMVTCYDYTYARIIDQTSIDAVLVGDSLSMVLYGEKTTLTATMDLMVRHIEAVKKGTKKPIIGDMPFLSCRKGLEQNIESVRRVIAAGASGIKIEGLLGNEELISKLHQSGVLVMGHLGLMPQFIHRTGLKVQAKRKEEADRLFAEALSLERLGCFSLCLEAVPFSLSKKVTEALQIPTIGIGAGPNTDGQILVLHDLLGLNSDFSPKFLRTFLDGESLTIEAIENYVQSVRTQDFPNIEESYD